MPGKTAIEEIFSIADAMRRAHGNVLDMLGFGPSECSYRVLASGPFWRLRDYGESHMGWPLLIVAAPIKRPYIWDLSASASAVRFCLSHGLHVYLLEWRPPSAHNGDVGLEIYGDQAIADAITAITTAGHGVAPFLIGHSLGGTLAVIFAALDPQRIRGLVLLGAPLCFQPGVSRFRDALVALTPSSLPVAGIVPGAMLSQLSALASPETFIWSRMIDAALSLGNARSRETNVMIERWALDEVALPARLVRQLIEWLYQENLLYEGTFPARNTTVGPSKMRAPTLAVVNTADEIAYLASIKPFIDAMPGRNVRLIEYPGENGVSLQHLALLVGPRAHAQVWPEIIAWLRELN
jgi:polyhydroxyalkanoate synthase